MNLRLNGTYTIAKGISDGITQQFLPRSSPAVPWRIYRKMKSVEPSRRLSTRTASASISSITQVVVRMEIAGLRKDSVVETFVGRDDVIVTYEKTTDFLHASGEFKLVYSDVKSGIFEQVIPFGDMNIKLSQRDVKHCIDDGVLSVILNNADHDDSHLDCSGLRVMLDSIGETGKEVTDEFEDSPYTTMVTIFRAFKERFF
jgi:HSP20 family molecular chaperone IbpA